MKRLFGKKVLLEMQDFENVISVDILSTNKDLIDLLNNKNIKFNIRNKHFFEQHFPKINHQGVAINIKDGQKISTIEELVHLNHQHSIVLIVDSIQDPQNFGAIIRSCAAFGVDAIIYKKQNQVPITDFVAKSSMGGLAKISMIEVTNLSNAIAFLKKAGY
jgi:23S rRNA (guanosine2251-2'-O)-methyltransferase